ncbi:helix-turn-helix domain-containing protein [Hydrogenibacillus schlegelii]|uniref:helix-turn-helix domain-containing protein n=1 Tax=Hydrogenibacillus schlegelii TaxID=1484 RepID=UPI0023533E56|nr:helix-turn-helix domain-containing protein [Hydrogenibacillus schlegelii]
MFNTKPNTPITPHTHPDDLPHFLTAAQVAAWLGWSVDTVRAKIRAGEIPAIAPSDSPHARKRVVPKTLLLRWIESAAARRSNGRG